MEIIAGLQPTEGTLSRDEVETSVSVQVNPIAIDHTNPWRHRRRHRRSRIVRSYIQFETTERLTFVTVITTKVIGGAA